MRMGDWPVFCYEQEDLAARSVVPFTTAREYFAFNQMYGGAEILRQYAGLPARPVPWAAQMIGFYKTADEELPASELKRPLLQNFGKSSLAHLFTIDKITADRFRELGFTDAVEIGHPFLYARELRRRRSQKGGAVDRRGTIAIPDKSDLGKLLDFDREAYAAKLVALPEEYHPVYVSMHWRDYERGCHEPYLRAGLKMVCSGHPDDPAFYHRLHDIFHQFKYSCSNEISTSFMLSVQSGCQFFYLDGGPVTIQQRQEEPLYTGPEPLLVKPGRVACFEASPFPPTESSLRRQQELAATFSGEAYLKPPEFFRDHWSSGREALSRQLKPVNLVFSAETTVNDLSLWLLYGVDLDGWADQLCGLEVPWREGFTAIELHIMHACPATFAGNSMITVTLDEDPLQTTAYPLTKSGVKICIPLACGQGTRKIDLAGPEPIHLTDELRHRSFRLAKILWLPHSQDQPDSKIAQRQPEPGPSSPKPSLLSRLFKFLK
jgi:hypothetical protein